MRATLASGRLACRAEVGGKTAFPRALMTKTDGLCLARRFCRYYLSWRLPSGAPIVYGPPIGRCGAKLKMTSERRRSFIAEFHSFPQWRTHLRATPAKEFNIMQRPRRHVAGFVAEQALDGIEKKLNCSTEGGRH